MIPSHPSTEILGQYTRILNHFDPEVNNNVSHVFLLEQALGSGPVPQAYLICANFQNQTRVYCLHLPSKYTSSLNGQVTPWDDASFVFLGEVVQGQTSTVTLPDMIFQRVANARAKSSDNIVMHLEDLGNYGPTLGQENG
jgi:hypothetical protein